MAFLDCQFNSPFCPLVGESRNTQTTETGNVKKKKKVKF